jgi:PAS domain S-box-containing protein
VRVLSPFSAWPLRAKMAALLVAASALPLLVAALFDLHEARGQLLADTAALLAARSDQLAGDLDTVHLEYQRSIGRLALIPRVSEFCQAAPADAARLGPGMLAALKAQPASDPNLKVAAILDAAGTVTLSTAPQLTGVSLAGHGFVRAALKGASVTSDLHIADPQAGGMPVTVYLAPVGGPDGKPLCVVGFWVDARAVWEVARRLNEAAGPQSFAVIFDSQGVRIGHSYNQDIVFHPGGPLPAAAVEEMVAERRFGERTRELLADVRPFPAQFERARAAAPDGAMFRGLAPVNGKWNYGVARRLTSVPRTVFYMLPEDALNAQIMAMSLRRAGFAGAIIVLALLGGMLFAATILRPVRALGGAAAALAGGDLAARVPLGGADELGQLGRGFNTMAERIEAQAQALQKARDELEQRVLARTAELQRTTDDLTAEMAERKRAEEAVRAGQELLRGIVDSTDDAIISKDPEGVITSWNRGAQALFGYTREEAVGRPMMMLIPADRADEEPRILERIARGESTDHFETVRLRKDGTRIDISVTISPIRDARGRVTGASKIARDITERKQAERKLRAQLIRLDLLHQITRAIGERQDLRSIFQVVVRSVEEQLPVDFCCICLHDAADHVINVTSVGLASAELAARLAMNEDARIPIDENGLSHCIRGQLIYEPDIAGLRFSFPERLATGGLRALLLAPLLVESKVFGVLVCARRQPESFSSGESEFIKQLSEHVALAAHQAQIYTALQEAYDELRQTQQAVMQQERLRALGQMASGIAHDINNAMSPAALYAESLLEREPDLSPRARGYLQTIQRAIEDVTHTVARMREFYRQREPQLTLAPVRLNQMVEQVLELTRARWSDMPQQRGTAITPETDLSSALPAVMGSESEIREALTNLVFNAVDAMPEGGVLTLRTRVSGDGPEGGMEARRVVVEVSDNGGGMDEATRARCLEPFFTTKGERGTGLGLAMVYGVIQRHSAEIEIDSTAGVGTTVRLLFPVAGGVAAGAPASNYAVPVNLPILVIDDDPLLLKSLSDILEADGHSVYTASGGRAGIDAFRAAHARGTPYAAVITDLGMPHIDGRQVATAIKQISGVTPVIMLTGWGQRLVADGEIPPHVDCVLNKPPKLGDLRRALALHCQPLSS